MSRVVRKAFCAGAWDVNASNDASIEVQIEIRAAYLYHDDEHGSEFTQIEWAGFNEDEEHSRGPFDLDDPQWQAGYLARAISDHSNTKEEWS